MNKKILVVEDTPENLEAAKTFFAGVAGYEFVYATNREEAEAVIKSTDAVITDRDMPYTGHVSDYEIENGYQIAIWAAANGKPVVMLTQHGPLNLINVNTEHEQFGMVSALSEEFFGRMISSRKTGCFENNESNELLEYTFRGDVCFPSASYVGLKKNTAEAWELAWNNLQKQF